MSKYKLATGNVFILFMTSLLSVCYKNVFVAEKQRSGFKSITKVHHYLWLRKKDQVFSPQLKNFI